MNFLGNNSGKLNDIIFENRNKAYGAYAIRQSYTDSLIKSLLFLSALVALIFGSAYTYSKLNAVASEEKIVMLDDPTVKTYDYVTEIDNTPLPKQKELQAPSATAPEGGMATRIVDSEPTNTVSTVIDNPVSGVGSATATGVAPTGTETGTTTVASTNTGTTTTTEEVVFAEDMPEFEGGNAGLMRYVSSSIIYPEIAKEAGLQGVVYVSFVVNETGKVEGAKVLKGIGLGCDEEVLRVINKMPPWKKPGRNAGHPVKVRFNIPVAFKLK